MSRIVSVWLRAWPIARLLRSENGSLLRTPGTRPTSSPSCGARDDAETIDRDRPLVLVAAGQGGPRITSCNRAAQRAGIAEGELLSNARAKALDLQMREADPAADAAALASLAVWALRYTPTVAVYDEESGADGLFLEITGCAHLFGGETALLEDLKRRLTGFGLAPRLGLADTAGAAWAVSHHHAPEGGSLGSPGSPGNPGSIVPAGAQALALRKLPLSGLRLKPEALRLLKRLGLKRIGEIMDQPRAPFAARFEADLLDRLDQALGRTPEPLTPVTPLPCYRAQTSFLDPIFSLDHVLIAAQRLLCDAAGQMLRDGVGARQVRLLLFRVAAREIQKTQNMHEGDADARVVSLDIGLAAASRDPAHIVRLFALRLERMGEGALETDFGFEAAALHVLVAEPLVAEQGALQLKGCAVDAKAVTGLVDRLRQRLGAGAVRALIPHQSHTPELAERAVTPAPGLAEDAAAAWAQNLPVAARPPLLLSSPEAAEVMALIPDGPPRRFRWRGVLYHVAEAQGPERIGPEWWRRTGEPMRDYYLVEDEEGRRFWIYRAGPYEADAPSPSWYVHGVFA